MANYVPTSGSINVAALSRGASQHFAQAGKGLDSLFKSMRDERKREALDTLFAAKPREAQSQAVTVDGTPDPYSIAEPAENALDFRARLLGDTNGIAGMSATERLGVANGLSEPYFKQEQQAQVQAQRDVDSGYKSAQLVQTADAQSATANYRSDVLSGQEQGRTDTRNYRNTVTTETNRHNNRMEIPTDIREAQQAGYVEDTGRKDKDGNPIMGVTEESFARYQDDKKTAQGQTEATENQIRSQIANRFYTQLGYDESALEAFNKLPTDQKEVVLDRFAKTGVIPFSPDTNGFFTKSNAGFDTSPIGDGNTTAPAGSKTVVQTFPDGSVLYSDGTTGTK